MRLRAVAWGTVFAIPLWLLIYLLVRLWLG